MKSTAVAAASALAARGPAKAPTVGDHGVLNIHNWSDDIAAKAIQPLDKTKLPGLSNLAPDVIAHMAPLRSGWEVRGALHGARLGEGLAALGAQGRAGGAEAQDHHQPCRRLGRGSAEPAAIRKAAASRTVAGAVVGLVERAAEGWRVQMRRRSAIGVGLAAGFGRAHAADLSTAA
jgi:hypothetical protein